MYLLSVRMLRFLCSWCAESNSDKVIVSKVVTTGRCLVEKHTNFSTNIFCSVFSRCFPFPIIATPSSPTSDSFAWLFLLFLHSDWQCELILLADLVFTSDPFIHMRIIHHRARAHTHGTWAATLLVLLDCSCSGVLFCYTWKWVSECVCAWVNTTWQTIIRSGPINRPTKRRVLWIIFICFVSFSFRKHTWSLYKPCVCVCMCVCVCVCVCVCGRRKWKRDSFTQFIDQPLFSSSFCKERSWNCFAFLVGFTGDSLLNKMITINDFVFQSVDWLTD